MEKRFTLAVVILFLTSLIAFAGGQGEEKGTAAVKVRLLYPGLMEKDIIDPISGIVKKGSKELEVLLEKKLPNIDVIIVSTPSSNFIPKTETMLLSKDADLAFYTNQIQAADWFMDNTEQLKNDPDLNFDTLDKVFVKGAMHYTKYRSFDKPQATGQIFGLPFSMRADFLAYDKKLFDDWGVAYPNETPTYPEILDKAKKTTGTNPKTGVQNYGIYFVSGWIEWHGVGHGAFHAVEVPNMDIRKLNREKDVEYIKNSKEVLEFFKFIEEAARLAPPGITTTTGNEKWLTMDNDIAMNIDLHHMDNYMRHAYANKKDVLDRFRPFKLPVNENGKYGFPDFEHFAIRKDVSEDLAKNCWAVLKALAIDKEVVDFCIYNYSPMKMTCLKDTSGMKIMEFPINRERYKSHLETVFITDDYWFWRSPVYPVRSALMSGEMTAEQARKQFYENVVKWIENKAKQVK